MRSRKEDTLCWDCTKSAAKSCAWSGRFEPDRRPAQPKRKDAYTEHDLCVIRNSIEDGESVSMIAWRLGRSLTAVTNKIRKMRRAGEL